ncbi:hypothetical protein MUP65_00585, partial [Patescibacteria group bacterium]|nr:hypothetical protein [Patescibacteria group bacterium]
DLLRRLLLVRMGVGSLVEDKAVQTLTVSQVRQLLRLFSLAAREIKGSVIECLPLEMAVVEWYLLQGKLPEKNGSETGGDVIKKTVVNKITSPSSSQAVSAKIEPVVSVEEKVEIIEPTKEVKVVVPLKKNDSGEKIDLAEVNQRWDEFLTQVKPMNHSLSALLKACRPQSVEGETLVLEVFYRFHKERLEVAKCRDLIEEAASTVFGLPVKIRCVLGKREVVATSSSSVKKDVVSQAEEMFGGSKDSPGVQH